MNDQDPRSAGPGRSTAARTVRRELERLGLLLASDARIPSVTSLVAGGPIRGSWWGHPAGHAIYQVLGELEDGNEVLMVKLIAGKITLVHRRLWPEVFGVGLGREPWQLRGLSPTASLLLKRLDSVHAFRADELPEAFPPPAHDARAAMRELERRLLAVTTSVHTASGAHSLRLEGWPAVGKRLGWHARPVRPESARRRLEDAVRELTGFADVGRLLPWPSSGARRARPGAAAPA